MGDHEKVITPEGWVDCSCGWESNHPLLPTEDEAAARAAVAAHDAQVVPPCPAKPELHPMVEPTDDEVAALRAWNAWQMTWGARVRPIEPTDHTGDPDPEHVGQTEAWEMHIAAVTEVEHADA